ncbi:unnamed protein product [Toxocara canis]|uniref:Helicase C-terminal domain-containing protein n=1 Tax=Toxocara canis TaxID=6265 RepID=A0A183VA97_TOXCA|nr:unnamed protein product [Toxocara canis]
MGPPVAHKADADLDVLRPDVLLLTKTTMCAELSIDPSMRLIKLHVNTVIAMSYFNDIRYHEYKVESPIVPYKLYAVIPIIEYCKLISIRTLLYNRKQLLWSK